MTGRPGVIAGFAHTAFNREHGNDDPILRASNAVRSIMDARNAIISAYANRAEKTTIRKKPTGRCAAFRPIGFDVQIASGKSWVGKYRAVAHIHSNLVLAKSGKLFKWRKYKARMIHADPIERFYSVMINNDVSIPANGIANIPMDLDHDNDLSNDEAVGESPSDGELGPLLILILTIIERPICFQRKIVIAIYYLLILALLTDRLYVAEILRLAPMRIYCPTRFITHVIYFHLYRMRVRASRFFWPKPQSHMQRRPSAKTIYLPMESSTDFPRRALFPKLYPI